jgi:hypothetical protein
MAAIAIKKKVQRIFLRRNRLFRDRTHPFDCFDETEIFRKFRFHRPEILAFTDTVKDDIELSNRRGSLPPLLQVLLALRFYASGAFQDMLGELIRVDQSTVSRTLWRVTNALAKHVPFSVRLPSHAEARDTARKFMSRFHMPGVFGCIDGTQIRIQAPSGDYEHEFVNRKNYHSINVQVSIHFFGSTNYASTNNETANPLDLLSARWGLSTTCSNCDTCSR